jgi:hypothetical protein
VKVTVRPATGVVLSSSKTPDKVAVPPLAMTVSPVYESVVYSEGLRVAGWQIKRGPGEGRIHGITAGALV